MKYKNWLLPALVFISCCDKTKPQINKITDVKSYKKEFNIIGFKKYDFDLNSLMDYKMACDFEYEEKMVENIDSYIIHFEDSSYTSIDVIKFKSSDYAWQIKKRLYPYIFTARNMNRMESRLQFCISHREARICNCISKDNILYLFTYDSVKPKYDDEKSSLLSSGKLKYIDAICEALKKDSN